VLAGRVLGVGFQLLLQPLELLLHLPCSRIARLQPCADLAQPQVCLGLPMERSNLLACELDGHRVQLGVLGAQLHGQSIALALHGLGLSPRVAPTLQSHCVGLGRASRHQRRRLPLLLHHLQVRLVLLHTLLRHPGARLLCHLCLTQPRHLRR
jgi:hypothetical protein